MAERIAVMGDSHVRSFLENAEAQSIYSHPNTFFNFAEHGYDFRVMKLGGSGATAFGLMNDDSESGARKTIKDNLGVAEHFVFMLGEVDVRAHAAVAEDPIASVIGAMNNYEEFVRDSVLPNVKGVIVICNALAHSMAAHKELFLKGGKHLALAEHAFNSAADEMCKRLSIRCLNLHSISSNGKGLVDEGDLEKDGTMCHIRPDVIRERLRRAVAYAVSGHPV